MIRLQNATLYRGTKLLFTDSTFTIFPKQKTALIGANGSGKTSLFSLLLGNLNLDHGELSIQNKARIACLEQEVPALTISAVDYVLDGDTEFREIERKLMDNKDPLKIANLHAKFEDLGGYTAKARAMELLHGLGFSAKEQQQLVAEFSGGWRTRLNLAKTLMSRNDLLLLDEPTNHLDLDAIIWLEKWLKKYPGTLLIISHDRDFINNIADSIIHIENQKIKLYSGNYDTFEKERALSLALQEANYKKQQQQIAHLEKFINRFRFKASKAKQAQSRIKILEKMEIISQAHIDAPFNFEFKNADKYPNTLLQIEKVSVGYEDKIVLKNVSLTINTNLRLGLLGRNGAGKSTLIKLMAGLLQPKSGIVTAHKYLKIGYFAQHQIDYLQLTKSPLEHFQELDTKTPARELRNFLGGFAFIGDQVLMPIVNFSGGEKARLALALLVWQRPNLLLLDEPTNHLDLDMRDALTFALQSYNGAVILVSHDRHLLRATVDEFILIMNGEVQKFTGDLDDYKTLLDETRRTEKAKKIKTEETSSENKHLESIARKKLDTQIKKVEDKLENLQKELILIDEKIADYYATNKDEEKLLQKYLAQQQKIKNDLSAQESLWLELVVNTSDQ